MVELMEEEGENVSHSTNSGNDKNDEDNLKDNNYREDDNKTVIMTNSVNQWHINQNSSTKCFHLDQVQTVIMTKNVPPHQHVKMADHFIPCNHPEHLEV